MANIWMVASEGLPFIKTGGLADVIGSLPHELVKKGHEICVVLPLYLHIAMRYHQEFSLEVEFQVSMKYQDVPVQVWSVYVKDVKFYFIEHQGYFEREHLYGYVDDGERFAYFQKAVLEMMKHLHIFPDILHTHDWHTGMLSVLCKELYSMDERYRNIKHLYTIHNLAYQGNFGADMLDSCLGLSNHVYENGKVRFDTGISFLKAGIVYADKVSTVSPSYAQEILTPQYGERLDAVLRLRQEDLVGITNGIDIEEWNPMCDSYLLHNYHKENVKYMKRKNKVALQKELGLCEDEQILMVGIVSRLTWQKGLQLLLDEWHQVCELPIQLVILGSGEALMEERFVQLEAENRGKVVFYKGYYEELAHRVYAASDLFLMPSLFEPCGISQLISMRYGTLPLVRETGGLKDTVQAYNTFEKTGNGFCFGSYHGEAFLQVLKLAVDLYYQNHEDWEMLVQHAMNTDVGFQKSAFLYHELYMQLI